MNVAFCFLTVALAASTCAQDAPRGTLALVATPASAQEAPSDTVWSDLFLADVESAADAIVQNHPGMVDDQNPTFRQALAGALAEARAAAPAVDGFTAYRVGLSRFADAFEDLHLSFSFRGRGFEGLRSAGIYPVYRDRQLVVAEVGEQHGHGSDLVGGVLLDCDGRPAPEVLRGNVLSWDGLDTLEAEWVRQAPLTLVDFGVTAPPSACRVQTDSGVRTVPLTWRPISDGAVRSVKGRLTRARPADWRVETFDGGDLVWVRIPSFQTRTEADDAALHRVVDRLARVDAWDTLVFDLRGNEGGSSTWGRLMAEAVFGSAWVAAAAAWLSDGVYVEFRVSRDNVAAMEANARRAAERFGEGHPSTQSLRARADALSDALSRGDDLLGTPVERAGVPQPDPAPVPGRIVLLTDGACFSACLDFVDVMRLHPAVLHAGLPTSADSQYMENWGRRLPSGLAFVGYPMKVYRNRRREAGEGVEPSARYEGSMANTVLVRHWVRGLPSD